MLQEKLHDVTSNEINLLNRIKSLEANDGYSRAEVDRCLSKEKDAMETQQRLQYRIECLETELDNANRVIDEQSSQVVIQRSPEDIELIEQQEQLITKLHEDVNYIKQELIEARSHKAASDDELGNVKGQLETLQNNISSLSEEGNRLRKQISILEETLEVRTEEANHMKTLVTQMEAAPGQEEQNKVQIADLKAELVKAEENLEIRTEETLQQKRDLRLKDEIIQQREIDISCLRGQVIALKRFYDPEKVICNDIDSPETNDDDSDTLTNAEPLSEEDILLEDLEFDNEIPKMENISSNDNKDNKMVQNINEEMNNLRNETSDALTVKEENNVLVGRCESIQVEAENLLKENERLSDELDRQQTLYGELKKMRGRGEEMDLLQQMEKETRDCQYRIQELEAELETTTCNVETLTEEKIRLLREIAQLKAGKGLLIQEPGINEGMIEHKNGEISQIPGHKYYSLSTNPKSAAEVAMSSIGSLRVYEMMLGLCFITIILNWILMP